MATTRVATNKVGNTNASIILYGRCPGVFFAAMYSEQEEEKEEEEDEEEDDEWPAMEGCGFYLAMPTQQGAKWHEL